MIYEFKCDKCDKHVDLHMKMAERNDDHFCEDCGEKMRYIVTGCAHVNLKGEGFYQKGPQRVGGYRTKNSAGPWGVK